MPAPPPPDETQRLEDMPNIGAQMAKWLKAAGIPSPEALRALGSIEAAIRVGPHRPDGKACKSALSALEGAIRGVRWHTIRPSERDALWREFQKRSR